MITATQTEPNLSAEKAREIAREACLYIYPMVENYTSIYQWAIDRNSDQYKGPFNQVNNVARVFGPKDTGVVTPNSDTPYSHLIMDLRAEPIVVTLPPVEPDRYYSLQIVDLYTHNVDYLGTRKDGNDGGDFLIAGPDWPGDKPAGIKRVVRLETQLCFSLFRTQLRQATDLENVKRIQAGYQARPLSTYLGQPAPASPSAIDFPPISRDTIEPQLFAYANFLLQFCPVHPGEQALRQRFAQIGIGPGLSWPPSQLSEAVQQAIEEGKQDGLRTIGEKLAKVTSSAGLFGTREEMAGKYLERAMGAKGGLYGNSIEEAFYPAYLVDAAGQPMDSGQYKYVLRFDKDKLPPVDAFWSLTMYNAKTRYLVENPINRYLINSTMLSDLQRDADGGITLYLQHQSPGADKESNWLPAPDGPMSLVMRLYLPKPEAIQGQWQAPPIVRADPPERRRVSPETFIRAESDRYFYNIFRIAGGVNQFSHNRTVTPLDQQTIVRMNKDTLYSGALVDTEGGATVTVPPIPDGRYASVLVLDNDHYAPMVIYEAGTHTLPQDTKYVVLAVRIQLFNPDDPAEIALVNQLQDQFFIQAGSADPFPQPQWDQASLDELRAQYEKEYSTYAYTPDDWQGPRGKVNEQTRHLAAAGGWGLFPSRDAVYINYNGHLAADQCYQATYQVPENNAFWSITVYGKDGYMKSERSILNKSNTQFNADGTFTAYFGSQERCSDAPNRLEVSEGWNFLMRVYRPGESVRNGSYTLPDPVPVQ